MPTLVSTFGVVAGLSVLSLFILIFGSRLPGPLRALDGGGTIGFALLVYFVALITLVVGAVGWSQVREILRSRFKHFLLISMLIVFSYVGFVSFALFSLSQATDL